jgi:hypothetical protein
MGHLDKNEKVIEAKLTELGRERLAKGEGLDITQFALSDDEVDYNLWQDNLPREDAGAIIENLPTYEALVDETQSMRYKLITLEEDLENVPQVEFQAGTLPIELDANSTSITVQPSTRLQTGPSTTEDTGLDNTLGYTAIVEDESNLTLSVPSGAEPDEPDATIPALYGQKQRVEGSDVSTAVGTEFELSRNVTNLADGGTDQTEITIIGNETGLSLSASIDIINN